MITITLFTLLSDAIGPIFSLFILSLLTPLTGPPFLPHSTADRDMEQATSAKHGGKPNPLDSTGLRLLSLDGGSVRELPTLYILKGLIDRLK